MIDFLERAAKLPQSSPAALDKLRRRIDLAAKFVDKSWTANKIAAYFDVTEVDLLRELRRAGKKLPVEVKEHRCWVRHGSPEDGTLHVDKDGLTCQAGAGSIQAGTYHGFLHHGKLTGCPG